MSYNTRKEAEALALKIGRRCVLDDGYFDIARCAAMLEPMFIQLHSGPLMDPETKTA